MTNMLNVKCKGCGTDLQYKPGTTGLTCVYCNHFMEFAEQESANDANTELNLQEHLNSAIAESQQVERKIISCKGCGAKTELAKNQQSGTCPFCDAAFIFEQAKTENLIKPKGILPFKIEKKEASANFKKWLSGLWFAPNALKKQATQFEKLRGIYLPFWTYDCTTFTSYTGQRGENYTETVSEKDANGNSVTRDVIRTRWYPASGSFDYNFDDVLVTASRSLPEAQLNSLAPWDLKSLVDYRDEYLSGYVTETYQIDLKTGYTHAKKIIDSELGNVVKQKIGGDDQRVTSIDTQYSNATFKHILLPVWVSAYHFQNKLYQVIVNARTGAVQGQRPWSWVKVASFATTIILAIGIGIYFFTKSH